MQLHESAGCSLDSRLGCPKLSLDIKLNFLTCLITGKIQVYTVWNQVSIKQNRGSFCKLSLKSEKCSKIMFANLNPNTHQMFGNHSISHIRSTHSPLEPQPKQQTSWCGCRKQEKENIWSSPCSPHKELSWSFPERNKHTHTSQDIVGLSNEEGFVIIQLHKTRRSTLALAHMP